jgi:hypothetical protein
MDRSIYKNSYQAKANGKSDNFVDGQGTAVILQCIGKTDGNEGPTFIARLKIVESSNKGDRDDKGELVPPNAVGSTVGWVQKLTKFKSAPGNLKGFILNTLGMKESEVGEDDYIGACAAAEGPEQALRGMLVKFSSYRQTTKGGPNAGKTNTYIQFSPVSVEAGNDGAKIAARRAELDKTDPVTG